MWDEFPEMWDSIPGSSHDRQGTEDGFAVLKDSVALTRGGHGNPEGTSEPRYSLEFGVILKRADARAAPSKTGARAQCPETIAEISA
jgi:hypothetical protein